MKANPDHDPADPRLDDNDALWRLLGESPRPEPDGWFTARTLARCRNERVAAESWGISLGAMWRWAIGSGVGMLLAVVLLNTQINSGSAMASQQKDVQDAFEIVASLNSSDSDSSSSSSSSTSPSWQDSSL